jgi:hypothetical protein
MNLKKLLIPTCIIAAWLGRGGRAESQSFLTNGLVMYYNNAFKLIIGISSFFDWNRSLDPVRGPAACQ